VTTAARCDVLLVGGGLANGLIAWRLRQRRPDISVLLVERAPTLGGRHTWSFHETDVEPTQDAWLAPLVRRSWPGHEVRFPGLRRRLRSGYRSIASEGFHRELSGALGPSAWLGRSVRELRADGATLDDGARIEACCVIDGRGFAAGPWLRAGFQRFLGLELVLENEHGLDVPLLMDADVPQEGGFRFFYLLPWDERRLLVEETLYSDDGAIDETRARAAIEAYARGRGWRVAAVEREERGALPIPLAGDVDALWSALPPGVGVSGMRAALFHPTTGYSLADAVRVADALASRASFDGPAVAAELRALSRASWRRQRFLRLLNRMLFEAALPERRYLVLSRFYRLHEGLIERFYAGRLTLADRVRLLVGRPPVPVGRALRCVRETTAARTAPAAAGAGTEVHQ
jgi:lycopene beta-cyclase